MNKTVSSWVEATRPRTLPVSVAGVLAAFAFAMLTDSPRLLPGFLCLLFALLCQIASNFANEYFDYRDGLDRPGRDGPRRGVTEGDITPQAMLIATLSVLAVASAIGCSLIAWGGPWLIAVGVAVALGVIAYSAGPYPLSRHALGEVAVLFFFGIIPVNMTYWLMTGLTPDGNVVAGSVAIGLMGANVLIVNNYRDMDDDRAVGKFTLALKLGPIATQNLYLFNGFIAVALMVPLWALLPWPTWIVPLLYLCVHTGLYFLLVKRHGRQLNPLLGMTAMVMLGYIILFLAVTTSILCLAV